MTIKQLGGVFGRNPTFNDVTIDGELIINDSVFTGLDYEGAWNASTNTPTLTSSVGTLGQFYIVSVAGATDLNGITNWDVGDWALFNGSVWQRVEGGADGNFSTLSVSGLATFGSGIDVTGNVGIGVVPETWHSTYDVLQIGSGGSLAASTTNESRVFLQANTYVNASNVASYLSTDEASQYWQNKGTHTFNVAPSGTADAAISWTTAMTIDNAGNLLVGKTASDIATAGHELLDYGRAIHTVTASTVQILNRKGAADGTIALYQRDGVAVGNIGAGGGNLNIGNGTANLRFTSGSISPSGNTAGGSSNGVTDLGLFDRRFKDLYLSGGVVFGTTGGAVSSKTLDDYEEGAWTPAYTPTTGTFTTITTVGTGRYTKVGRLVTVFGSLYTSGALDVTGASGNLKITGLPYACNATVAGGGADLGHQSWNLGTDILNTRMSVAAGGSEILMSKNTMNGSSFPSGNITVADMSTSGGAFANLISFTASYEV